jgi:hypothetical protein
VDSRNPCYDPHFGQQIYLTAQAGSAVSNTWLPKLALRSMLVFIYVVISCFKARLIVDKGKVRCSVGPRLEIS